MTQVYVHITATRGSAPRDAGTAMAVCPTQTRGTIGGGALEFRAIAIALDMLRTGAADKTRTFPLGPALGQCCGGAVTLQFTRTPVAVDTTPPLPALKDQARTQPVPCGFGARGMSGGPV